MTINLGPISGFHVHLTTRPNPLDRDQVRVSLNLPGLLCTDGGDRLEVRHLHTWTSDSVAVTCPRCIEWMHA